jgi:hypothetical protein
MYTLSLFDAEVTVKFEAEAVDTLLLAIVTIACGCEKKEGACDDLTVLAWLTDKLGDDCCLPAANPPNTGLKITIK